MLSMNALRGFDSFRMSQACQRRTNGLIEDEPEPAPIERECGHKGNSKGLCFGKPSCAVGVKIKDALDAAKLAAKAAVKEARQLAQAEKVRKRDAGKAEKANKKRRAETPRFQLGVVACASVAATARWDDRCSNLRWHLSEL